MEENVTLKTSPSPSGLPYFVSIRFRGSDKSYCFSTADADLKVGDLVVVETITGYEIGSVCKPSTPMSLYHSALELKPILRRPNKGDLSNYEYNLAQAKRALELCQKDVKMLGLAMDLVDAVYTLDGEKVTITYTTPEKRVDFRELLHTLSPKLGCRIELRQIANRDKAKMIGGIGICGLPLCCSTFLTTFEGISIQRAKNQMLTLNMPKITGPCEKLMCCLLYEDEMYTEAKRDFPRHGEVIHTPEGDYSVDSFNVLSKNVRLVNATRDDYKTYPLEDIRAMQKGTYKKKAEEDNHFRVELPDYHLNPSPSSAFPEEEPQKKGQAPSNPKKQQSGGRNNQQQGQNNRRRRNGNNYNPGRGGNGDPNRQSPNPSNNRFGPRSSNPREGQRQNNRGPNPNRKNFPNRNNANKPVGPKNTNKPNNDGGQQ